MKISLKKPKIFTKIGEFFKNLIDKDDKRAIIRFLANVMTGLLINLMLFSVFSVKFSWYSWIGYGILVHLVEIRLVKWIRLIRFK